MATDKPPHQIGKAACKDGYRAYKNVNGMWENTPHERVPLRAVTVRTTGRENARNLIIIFFVIFIDFQCDKFVYLIDY
ncbi:MAG: hypothetical protein MR446_09090 [Bacteroidales bacterium]|nr:hypothetical protein [Bacteroidales bacterium]